MIRKTSAAATLTTSAPKTISNSTNLVASFGDGVAGAVWLVITTS